MAKPKLEKIVDMFQLGENFSITREQYIYLTGADIPQSKSYTESKSAIAKKANSFGFKIEVIPELLKFTFTDKK